MGHYDDYYIKEQNEKAAKLPLEAMMTAIPQNKEQFRIKIKEAIFWLEN